MVWDARRHLPTYASGFIEVLQDYAKTSYPGHQLGSSPASFRVTRGYSEDGLARHTHQDWRNIGTPPATDAGTTNDTSRPTQSIVKAAPDDRKGA